jgi:SAM-dependent MidA family methyltransferase
LNDLIAVIRARIEADGPVAFAWFMEQALYHPQFGYYSSGRATIGRSGDYFTNVSVGPIYGTLVAVQLAEVWQQLGRPAEFVMVEQGGHEGELARDILRALESEAPECYEAFRCRLIESFSVLREKQAQTLADFGEKVDWCESLEQLEPFTGVHFSNELLDAFPVHLVRRRAAPDAEAADQEWEEKLVDWKDGEFVFTDQEIGDAGLQARVRNLPPVPAGYETEINLAALEWIDLLSSKLCRGYVLAVDYGFPREEFYAPHRTAGTLQCRWRHRLLPSPLHNVGQCDITAHIDWTGIAERAVERGLLLAAFADQHHFLTGILAAHPELLEQADPNTRRALQTLLHPEMLGRSFQVLALSRGLSETTLSGFKFARFPAQQLGLTFQPT